MDNNYLFWESYLEKIKDKILELCLSKKELQIDFHIHSNHSADGKQTVKEIIETTKNKGFDIISITDHDSVSVYDEIYNLVKEKITSPIIIPGIEFTIDNKEYGNQCHLLQLFINPKDEILLKDVKKNYNAMFNRSKIQFNRLKYNDAIQKLIIENNIKISYNDYLKYLDKNLLVPEYDTLCMYLSMKFKEKKITNFTIFDLLKKYNQYDCYEDRKQLKMKRYKKLEEKYAEDEENNYNVRFLLSMLAVREVDDDWWEKPMCGSLSVNSYGQLKVEELNDKYDIYFAHPTENSLNIVKSIIERKKNIKGLELNIRNKYENIENFYNLLKEKKLIMIIGSDSHDSSAQFYNDSNFYKISSENLKKIL